MKNIFIFRLVILALTCLILSNCSAPQKMRVLIKMMPAQEEHFRKKVIPPFEKKNNAKVEVRSMENINELPDLIQQADNDGGINLVKVPFELTRVLTGKNLILPLDSIITPDQIKELKNEYFLLDLVKINKQYHYLPRKFETRMLLYLKPQVRNAVQG